MSKSSAFETDVLNKIFWGIEYPWASISNLYCALHTADPNPVGLQTAYEGTYSGYSRAVIPRNATGWAVVNNQAANAIPIVFPVCTGGTNTATHFSVGTSANGLGQILYSGVLSSPLSISNNIRPEFPAASLIITED